MVEKDDSLPEVDLSAVIADLQSEQDKGQEAPEPVETQEGQGEAAPAPAGQTEQPAPSIRKFKTIKDLEEAYKNLESFTTKVSQENSTLRKSHDDLATMMAQLKDEIELRRAAIPAYPPPAEELPSIDEIILMPKEEQLKTLGKIVQYEASKVNTRQRIVEVLEDEETNNPDEYHERLAYVQYLSKMPKYADLSYSPKGVKKLFEEADKVRAQKATQSAQKFLKSVLGDDFDFDRFKQSYKKDAGTPPPNTPQGHINPNAYMPSTSTATRTGLNQQVNFEALKSNAVKKGDVEEVTKLLLLEKLHT